MANGTFFSSLVRLYHATFNRESDMEGIGYWASHLARGEITFEDVVNAFVSSPEFEERYGEDLTNEEFIILLYSNVLGREVDDDGMEFWLSLMNQGLSRAAVLHELSESEEHKNKIEIEYEDELAEAEQTELEQTSDSDDDSDDDDSDDDDSDDDDSDDDDSDDDDSDDDDSDDDDSDDDDSDDENGLSIEDALELLYEAAFNREADTAGKGHWLSLIARGEVELDDISEIFIASDEFQERYGPDLSDNDFIEALYNNTLGRNSDEAGKAHWFGALSSGLARHDLLEIFAESQEHQEIVLTGTSDDSIV
jgi:hypothetical protein